LIQGSHDRSAWTIWGILCDCETSGTILLEEVEGTSLYESRIDLKKMQ
jgi:hypothetical protein